MPSPELVIFDCDGVLVDSEIVAARVEAKMLGAAGFEIEAEELAQRYAGLTFKDILMAIEAEADMLFEAKLIEKVEEEVDRRLRREVKAIDGVGAAVSAIATPKCICSNSSRDRIQAMLEKTGLDSLFAGHVYSALDTPTQRPKPAPDVFEHAAAEMKADPRRTFVIEDSVHGVSAATAAGMRVIGFTGATHAQPGHADALTEAGAETVIHRMRDLGEVLVALSAWSENA